MGLPKETLRRGLPGQGGCGLPHRGAGDPPGLGSRRRELPPPGVSWPGPAAGREVALGDAPGPQPHGPLCPASSQASSDCVSSLLF